MCILGTIKHTYEHVFSEGSFDISLWAGFCHRCLKELDWRLKLVQCRIQIVLWQAKMKVSTPTISWHNRERVSSVDFQPVPHPSHKSGSNKSRLASAGDDKHVVVCIYRICGPRPTE